MPNINYPSQGFTLLELLISLFLTALMVMGITQYLLVSSHIHLTMQQESLAAKTLESFLIQASFNSDSKDKVKAALSIKTCPDSTLSSQLDLTYWCQALVQLPNLEINSNHSSLSLEWQAPKGKRKIIRQPFQKESP